MSAATPDTSLPAPSRARKWLKRTVKVGIPLLLVGSLHLTLLHWRPYKKAAVALEFRTVCAMAQMTLAGTGLSPAVRPKALLGRWKTDSFWRSSPSGDDLHSCANLLEKVSLEIRAARPEARWEAYEMDSELAVLEEAAKRDPVMKARLEKIQTDADSRVRGANAARAEAAKRGLIMGCGTPMAKWIYMSHENDVHDAFWDWFDRDHGPGGRFEAWRITQAARFLNWEGGRLDRANANNWLDD